MFNGGGESGSLGTARGSIVIDISSIDAAVQAAQQAAETITAAMAKIAAAQDTLGMGKGIKSLEAQAAAVEAAVQRQLIAQQKLDAQQTQSEAASLRAEAAKLRAQRAIDSEADAVERATQRKAAAQAQDEAAMQRAETSRSKAARSAEEEAERIEKAEQRKAAARAQNLATTVGGSDSIKSDPAAIQQSEEVVRLQKVITDAVNERNAAEQFGARMLAQQAQLRITAAQAELASINSVAEAESTSIREQISFRRELTEVEQAEEAKAEQAAQRRIQAEANYQNMLGLRLLKVAVGKKNQGSVGADPNAEDISSEDPDVLFRAFREHDQDIGGVAPPSPTTIIAWKELSSAVSSVTNFNAGYTPVINVAPPPPTTIIAWKELSNVIASVANFGNGSTLPYQPVTGIAPVTTGRWGTIRQNQTDAQADMDARNQARLRSLNEDAGLASQLAASNRPGSDSLMFNRDVDAAMKGDSALNWENVVAQRTNGVAQISAAEEASAQKIIESEAKVAAAYDATFARLSDRADNPGFAEAAGRTDTSSELAGSGDVRDLAMSRLIGSDQDVNAQFFNATALQQEKMIAAKIKEIEAENQAAEAVAKSTEVEAQAATATERMIEILQRQGVAIDMTAEKWAKLSEAEKTALTSKNGTTATAAGDKETDFGVGDLVQEIAGFKPTDTTRVDPASEVKDAPTLESMNGGVSDVVASQIQQTVAAWQAGYEEIGQASALTERIQERSAEIAAEKIQNEAFATRIYNEELRRTQEAQDEIAQSVEDTGSFVGALRRDSGGGAGAGGGAGGAGGGADGEEGTEEGSTPAASSTFKYPSRVSRSIIPFAFLANQLGAGGLGNTLFTAQAGLAAIEWIPVFQRDIIALSEALAQSDGIIGQTVAKVSGAIIAFDEETGETAALVTSAGSAFASVAVAVAPVVIAIAAIVFIVGKLNEAYAESAKEAKLAADAITSHTEVAAQARDQALQTTPTELRGKLRDAEITQANTQRDALYYDSRDVALNTGFNAADPGKNLLSTIIDRANALTGQQATNIVGALRDLQTAREANTTKLAEATTANTEAIKQLNIAQAALDFAERVQFLNAPTQASEFVQQNRGASSSDITQRIADDETRIGNARLEILQSTKEAAERQAMADAAVTDETKKQYQAQADLANQLVTSNQGIDESTSAEIIQLQALLPIIRAREAETKAINETNEKLKQQADLQKLLEGAIATGDPAKVRSQIVGLQTERDNIQRLQLEPNQQRYNAAAPRVAALAASLGVTPDKVSGSDQEFTDAKANVDAANKAIGQLNDQIVALTQFGISGAETMKSLGAEQQRVDLQRRNATTSSSDLQSQVARANQDVIVSTQELVDIKGDERTATDHNDQALLHNLQSVEQDTQARHDDAQATASSLSPLIAVAKAREDETRILEEQRAALQYNIQHQEQLADAIRNATPDQAAGNIQSDLDKRQALEDALPNLQLWAEQAKSAKEMVDQLTAANEPVSGELQAMADQAKQAATDLASARTELGQTNQDYVDLLTKVVPAAMVRATDDFIDDITKLRIDSQEKVSQINQDEQDKEADSLKKYNDSLADTDEKDKKDRLKAEEDFNDRRAKIEKTYMEDYTEAVGNRDALAALKAQQKRDDDLSDLNKDYDKQKKALDDALKEQQDTAKKRYDQELQDARDNAAKQLRLEQQRLRDQISERTQAYQKELEQLSKLGVTGAGILANMAINGIDSLSVLGNSAATIFANMAAQAAAIAKGGAMPPIIPNTQVIGLPGLTQAQAQALYQAYQMSQGVTFAPLPNFATHALGTPFLHADEIARLHAGEAVINAPTNAIIRSYLGNNYSDNDIVTAVAGKYQQHPVSNSRYNFQFGDMNVDVNDVDDIANELEGHFHAWMNKTLRAGILNRR